MSTVPRATSAVDGMPPNFGTVLGHTPELQAAFGRLYGIFWSHGVVDQPTKEVTRMRNARVTDCGF